MTSNYWVVTHHYLILPITSLLVLVNLWNYAYIIDGLHIKETPFYTQDIC